MTAHLLLLLLTCLSLTGLRAAPPVAVQLRRLRCELLANPKGIDATAPRLSWELGVVESIKKCGAIGLGGYLQSQRPVPEPGRSSGL